MARDNTKNEDRDPAIEARLRRLAGRDNFNTSLGIEFVEGRVGHAVVRLMVSRTHLNFYGYCHGGVIFTLADAAFGLANNSRESVSVAIDAHITFANPVREGDLLTATATEITARRSISTFRIQVELADGTPVSSFSGTAYNTGKPIEE